MLLKREMVWAGTSLTKKTHRADVTENFSVIAIGDNNLLLDFVKVSFDGTEYLERKHTEQVLDELIRTQYQGKLYLKYEFVARGIPEKLSLLTQNNRVVALTPIIEPTLDGCLLAVSPPALGVFNFHGLTGGVYKARERIHRGMLTRDY